MFINMLNKRQLSPDGDGGGFIPLEDIEAEEEKTDPAKGADLEEAARKQAAEDAAKAEQEAKEKEEAERKAKEEAEAKKATDSTKDEGNDEEEEEGTFWQDVDKLRGEELSVEVDFGDVDPNTPEGALIYEKAVRADALNKFEQYLSEAHPRALAYLEHVMSGGKEEDFFKKAGEATTLPTEAELENNLDLQKELVARSLKSRNLPDRAIEATIKAAITDDSLEEMAKDLLKEEQKRQEDAIAAARTQTEAEVKARNESIKQMADYVTQVTATGKLDNVIIPEKDRAPFAKAVNDSIRLENGKFYMVTELTNDNVIKAFKTKFFDYKNGNLTDLIDKQARTENTKRLQRSVPENKKPLGSGAKATDNSFVSMSELDD